MSLSQLIANSSLAKVISRKINGPLERAWGETFIDPCSPLADDDLRLPVDDSFPLTVAMELRDE